MDLAFRGDYYLFIRLSNVLPDNGYIHLFTLNTVMALLGQSTAFSITFLITEIILTYKYKVISTTLRNFILKNYPVILTVLLTAIINIVVMVKIEGTYTSKYLNNNKYSKTFGVTDRLAEGTLITVILMYLYALLTIHDN